MDSVNMALLIGFAVSAALNVFMMFRVYNAIPREALDALIDFAGRRAGETPETTDDQVVELLRTINEWIQQQPPAQG